ncbi:SPFH domain-containing protein [Acetobacter nitrogenifigens DSM 23921 = NBRC 105050]|nr:SPFH domain-containing protein [Acetobacter nitrogenifigens DSM 23921 = NBRC 105050]
MQSQVEKISDVKTRDDAFIRIQWVLRYAVNDTPEGIMAYAYKVEEPVKRLVFKVENEIRQIISGMTMDELYRQRDTIAEQVMSDQEDDAQESGVKIHGVTIEQPMPPEQVQVAMNNKLAAIARKEAAEAEAEAERVRRVGIARAEAESKRLQGEGIANERKAIAEGFRDAMQKLQEGLPEASSQEILALLLSVNENDMVTTASQTGKATVIFVPRSMDYATAQAAMREVRN